MLVQLIVRAAIVLACVGGIVVAVISYQSQRSFDQGFERVVAGQLDDRTRELLEDGRPLSRDVRIDQGLAFIDHERGRDPIPRLERALEREPENVGLVAAYGVLLAAEGRSEESQDAYRRAGELDPQRFPER